MRGLLLALVVLAACDTTAVDPGPVDVRDLSQEPGALVGTWDWESSTYYYTATGAPVTQTPETTGHTETYVFEADGTVEVYRDGALERTETYEVKRRVYGNGTESDRPLLFIGEHDVAFGIDGDLLVFDDTPVDGPLARYRRH